MFRQNRRQDEVPMPQPQLATFTMKVAAHDAADEPRAEGAFRDLLMRMRNVASRSAAEYPDLIIDIWLEPATSDRVPTHPAEETP
jgi:hypothetical protein